MLINGMLILKAHKGLKAHEGLKASKKTNYPDPSAYYKKNLSETTCYELLTHSPTNTENPVRALPVPTVSDVNIIDEQ